MNPACSSASDFYWNCSVVSSCALHSLSSCNVTGDLEALRSPAMFFIQLIRLSLSLAIFTVIAALYNCISVLNRNLLSTATCSIYWVIFFALIVVKSTILTVLVPTAYAHTLESPYIVNSVGFIVTSMLQITLTYLLILALDHERRFRSPDNASIDDPSARCCVGHKLSRLVCSYWRVGVSIYFLLPLCLLIALEVYIQIEVRVEVWLAWLYVGSLVLMRVIVVVSVVHIVLFTKGNCDPTVMAKVYLVTATILSLAEDIPNSPLTMPLGAECLLTVISLYDLFQIVGSFSLVLFALFIRSQYLRIEQECKLVLVWDMQKLLQVNGRKDIVKYS